MKAEHRHELEQNALNRGLSHLAEKAKAGEYLNFRTYLILATVVVLVAAGGYWWYARAQHRTATASLWNEMMHISGPSGLEEFAKDSKDPATSRIARLELARVWLGPDGLQNLSSTDPDKRRKAIESIEKARKEFEKLADEFKNDPTLKAQSIDALAHAELALVGIPKEGTFDQWRGSVSKAAELFREYAKLVGEGSKPGEEAKKKADDLVAHEQDVLRVAQALNDRLSQKSPEVELPKGLFDKKPDMNFPPLKTPDRVAPPLPPPGTTPPAPTPPNQKAPDTKAPVPPAGGTPAAPSVPPAKAPDAKAPMTGGATPPAAPVKAPDAKAPSPPPSTKK
jgi:hypothetical protein